MASGCGDDGNADTSEATSADSTTTAGEETGESGDGDACASDFVDKPNASATDVMTDFGAACSADADCSDLGDGAKCQQDVLGVFELPGGFCTKSCELPDTDTTFLNDATDCDAGGGVSCVGAAGLFTACARPCTEDSECSREGYGCIRMPVISGPDDETFCLMNEATCCLDPDMCTTPP